MALVAYTSAAILPLIAQSDAVIDMAVTALPTTANLYGDGLDSLDPVPTLTFAWTILEKPAGSAVNFVDTGTDSSTLQNPVLQDIDTWENIRVMLVVTNLDNGAVSEADRFLAPDTAFVHVRLQSVTAGLQKPAYGERNHKEPWHEVVAAMEALATGGVVIPPEIWQLVSGGYAEYPVATVLHKHFGTDINVATQAVQGVVLLSDAPVAPLAPKALNVDYHPMSVQVSGTPTALGWVTGIEEAVAGVGGTKYPHALFQIKDPCTMRGFSVDFADFGDMANSYDFEVYYGPRADWYAGAALSQFAAYDLTVGPAAADNSVLGDISADTELSLAAGYMVGIYVASGPSSFVGDRTGNAMTVTAHLYRKV